jgi:hypothetical protein
VRECDFTLAQVYSADEAFVTGTLGGVTPVVRIDGRAARRLGVARRFLKRFKDAPAPAGNPAGTFPPSQEPGMAITTLDVRRA